MVEHESPGWGWDESLYAGAAAHYSVGRVAYPPELATALAGALGLDGTGTLLDVGCGPGSVTLLLAPLVGTAIGVDADPAMLAEGARIARERGIDVTWIHLRAEELAAERLPAGSTPVRLIVLAQSFHWMDRPRVAAILRGLLAPDGALVHVSATTHQGEPSGGGDGSPPWPAIEALVVHYLGERRRAGQGVRPGDADDEDQIYWAAGLRHDDRIVLPSRTVRRGVGEIVSAVHSLSWAAPHLFGDRLGAFDAELEALLDGAARDGGFTEELAPTRLDVWR